MMVCAYKFLELPGAKIRSGPASSVTVIASPGCTVRIIYISLGLFPSSVLKYPGGLEAEPPCVALLCVTESVQWLCRASIHSCMEVAVSRKGEQTLWPLWPRQRTILEGQVTATPFHLHHTVGF